MQPLSPQTLKDILHYIRQVQDNNNDAAPEDWISKHISITSKGTISALDVENFLGGMEKQGLIEQKKYAAIKNFFLTKVGREMLTNEDKNIAHDWNTTANEVGVAGANVAAERLQGMAGIRGYLAPEVR